MKRGQALDLRIQIRRRITAQTGVVWTPVDFLALGPRAAIDKALQRLARSGDISRIDRGLYFRPRTSALTGTSSHPDQKAVIDAVARRDQMRVVVDGMTAADDLGLTTAVPARVISFGEAGELQKLGVSHRGGALRAMMQYLAQNAERFA